MTARKPIETTAPVIPADEAFANVLADARDKAVAEGQRLRAALVSFEETHRRDEARRKAIYDAEWASLDGQITRQAIVASVANDAIEDMSSRYAPGNAPSNVVQITQAAE